MPTPDELKQRIETAIPGAVAEVTSADNVHFQAVVTAAAFEPGELGGTVHALQLKTEVP